ncbi:MAPEG family protein [Bradyrhizobium prioriisuperbiae]|uniref:MAPEG family protein n=1 Tax=Bradyrhizobium prioriisuperbiae TaxID=2854389 RepID=UPI0028EF90FF|nr:MAPEG family protein [Bradyrhizobium prioritasuperba]
MPLAYWCVLITAILPIAIVSFAKAGGGGDNHDPRAGIDSLPDRQRRGYFAHLNAYENFPFFAVAVVVAVTMGAPIHIVNILAVIYVALRIAHALLYIGNIPTARSLVFLAGYLVNIAIFVLPAFK